MNPTLPRPYAEALGHLATTVGPLPLMVREAIRLHGVVEAPGKADNPTILAWAKELGIESTYSADSIPWCGLYLAIVAKRAGRVDQIPATPLWALSWRNFGMPVTTPMLGDVLVMSRKTASGATAGHVCNYIGEDDTHYHAIGGNQSDRVNIARFAKTRKLWFRRPTYREQPKTVRKLFFKSTDAQAGGSEA